MLGVIAVMDVVELVERFSVVIVLIWFLVYVVKVMIPGHAAQLQKQGEQHKQEIDAVHTAHKAELTAIHARHENVVQSVVDNFRQDLLEERKSRLTYMEAMLTRANFECPMRDKV